MGSTFVNYHAIDYTIRMLFDREYCVYAKYGQSGREGNQIALEDCSQVNKPSLRSKMVWYYSELDNTVY